MACYGHDSYPTFEQRPVLPSRLASSFPPPLLCPRQSCFAPSRFGGGGGVVEGEGAKGGEGKVRAHDALLWGLAGAPGVQKHPAPFSPPPDQVGGVEAPRSPRHFFFTTPGQLPGVEPPRTGACRARPQTSSRS